MTQYSKPNAVGGKTTPSLLEAWLIPFLFGLPGPIMSARPVPAALAWLLACLVATPIWRKLLTRR